MINIIIPIKLNSPGSQKAVCILSSLFLFVLFSTRPAEALQCNYPIAHQNSARFPANISSPRCENIFSNEPSPVLPRTSWKFGDLFRGYVKDRSLEDYNRHFIQKGMETHRLNPSNSEKDPLITALKNLPETASIADFGCGRGHALSDIQTLFPQFQLWGFRLGNPWSSFLEKKKSIYIYNSDFSHLTQEQVGQKKFDTAFDLYGIISYSPDLYSSLQKELDSLKIKGQLFLKVDMTTYFDLPDETVISMSSYLKLIKGIQVEELNSLTFIISRTEEKIVLPKITLTSFKDDNPPARRYFMESTL